jgi:uncharacterized membrane protein YeiH
MLIHTQNLQLALDVVGVFVFALSGGLVAVRVGLDLFGVLVLSGAAGLGGGVIRDVLLGIHPPIGLSDWRLLLPTVVAGLITFRFHPSIGRIAPFVRILDAAGLAAFAITGTLKALGAGTPAIAAIGIGGITAVGGGVIRDLLAGEVPEVLRRELYAIPALLGSALLTVAHKLDVLSTATIWGCVAVVFAVRIIAVMLDLNAPRPLRTRTSAT